MSVTRLAVSLIRCCFLFLPKIIRPLRVVGFDDAPHGHAEMVFDNVRLPASSIIAGPGRGFEIAQGRLGPGRIHHCMRLLGMCERSLEWMCARVDNRVAFGKPLSQQGGMQDSIAESRMDVRDRSWVWWVAPGSHAPMRCRLSKRVC